MRALAWRLADARESERKDLAREQHDRVGQDLTTLDLYLSTIRGQLPEADPCAAQIRDRLDASLALLAQTAEGIRDVMADLRPPVLNDWGLVAALEWHASRCATDYGIAIAVEGQEPDPPPTAPVALALFRIAQEALNNVSKHARASRVTVSVEPGPDGQAVRLVVADDGVGFEVGERTRPTGGYH